MAGATRVAVPLLALFWAQADAQCPCLQAAAQANYTGIGVIWGEPYDFGSGYGMDECRAHDEGLPPVCEGPAGGGQPRWCTKPWCYVNSSVCDKPNSPSILFPGFAYSYAACGSTFSSDTYAREFDTYGGLIRLCSVFSTTDSSLAEVDPIDAPAINSTPCGNSATHLQVEAMVTSINELNGGRGFAVEAGAPRSPLYVRFHYEYSVYPFGMWESIGRNMSLQAFSGDCDVVVGMANGCPDAEISKQGLIANETQRIFITGRGPRGVRTLFGLNQPYFFSTHLNSDMYAHPALGQMRLAGARTAHILYEDYGNFFYTDLGTNAADGAAAFGYTVTTGVLIRAAGTNFNLTLLNASLDAAIAAAPDVLVLVLRQPEWAATLARLSGLRPGTAALKRGERRHAFKAVWFQGNSWSGNCAGEGPRCAHVLGASQFDIVSEALDEFGDALLDGRTYRWLRYESGYMDEAASSFVDFPDAAVIPSLIAQAFQQIFRFRPLARSTRPLQDAQHYELLRYFLASGSVVAETFYGPMSFDAFGQNQGREPSTMQVTAPGTNGTPGGLPLTILPTQRAVKALVYPSPASSSCPSTAFERAFRRACLLCEPEVCVLQGPKLVLILSITFSLLFVFCILAGILAFLYYSSFNKWLRLREPLRLIEEGSVPHPPLAPGKRYHLFLSHCWFSGQDQCGVIKRRLRLLLPDAVTFLDVDDLESTSHLESHVRASSSVLIFLSRCYFESHNCRREVLAAIENCIPLILVHEMQKDKSTPLAALRASCITYCGEHAVSSAFPWRKGVADGTSSPPAGHTSSHRAEESESVALPDMCRRADFIVRRVRATANARAAEAESKGRGSESEEKAEDPIRARVVTAMLELAAEVAGPGGVLTSSPLRVNEHGSMLLHDKLGFACLGQGATDASDAAVALLTSRPAYLRAVAGVSAARPPTIRSVTELQTPAALEQAACADGASAFAADGTPSPQLPPWLVTCRSDSGWVPVASPEELTLELALEAEAELRLFVEAAAEMGSWVDSRLFLMQINDVNGLPQPRPVVSWVRSDRLQLESFKQICEGVIHACTPQEKKPRWGENTIGSHSGRAGRRVDSMRSVRAPTGGAVPSVGEHPPSPSGPGHSVSQPPPGGPGASIGHQPPGGATATALASLPPKTHRPWTATWGASRLLRAGGHVPTAGFQPVGTEAGSGSPPNASSASRKPYRPWTATGGASRLLHAGGHAPSAVVHPAGTEPGSGSPPHTSSATPRKVHRPWTTTWGASRLLHAMVSASAKREDSTCAESSCDAGTGSASVGSNALACGRSSLASVSDVRASRSTNANSDGRNGNKPNPMLDAYGSRLMTKRSHTSAPPVVRLGELVYAEGEVAHLGGLFIAHLAFGARRPRVHFSLANAGAEELTRALQGLYGDAVEFVPMPVAPPPASSPRLGELNSIGSPSPGQRGRLDGGAGLANSRWRAVRVGQPELKRLTQASHAQSVRPPPGEVGGDASDLASSVGRATGTDFLLLLLNREGLARGNTALPAAVAYALDRGLRPLVLHDLRPSEVDGGAFASDFSAHMDLWRLRLGSRSQHLFQRIASQVHGGDAHFAASAVLIAEAMGAKATPLTYEQVAHRKRQLTSKSNRDKAGGIKAEPTRSRPRQTPLHDVV